MAVTHPSIHGQQFGVVYQQKGVAGQEALEKAGSVARIGRRRQGS